MTSEESVWWKSGTAAVVWIALGTVVVHLATGWRYGFDRDELMALEDARHLAWGYVQYPPMTAFLGRVALELFGTSLVGFRLFATVAQGLAVVLTGLLAKEIWWTVNQNEGNPKSTGKSACATESERWVMVVAAMVGVPFCLGAGALMQYISFDYVCWVWVAYCVVKIVVSGEWRVASGRKKQREEVEEWNGESVGGLKELEQGEMRIPQGRFASWAEAQGLQAQERNGEMSESLETRDELKLRSPGEEFKTHPSSLRVNPQDHLSFVNGSEIGGAAERHGSKDPPLHGGRWWVGVGVGIGLGMMAKYTMLFLVAGLVVGVLVTGARRYLRSGWLWLGVVVALGIFLPNFIWEWERGFVSLEFLRFLHVRDVGEGLTDWFLLGQVELTLLAFPLALAGIWFYFFTEEGKRFRILGWMYLVPLVLFLVMRGRDYYLAPGYPMLYAAGAVWVERKWRVASGEWRKTNSEVRNAKMENGEEEVSDGSDRRGIHRKKARWKTLPHSADSVRNGLGFSGRWVKVIWVCLVLDVIVAGAVALPIAPVNSGWWKFASRVDSVFPEEIGWPEFVEGVAAVRDRLPAEEQGRVGILAGNYGEVGALNLYGEKFGLPRAISGVNSSWERGYGDPAPEIMIVVGYPREFLEGEFASCVVAGRTRNRYGVMNEETIEDPEIFVCRGLKSSWKEFWGKARKFA